MPSYIVTLKKESTEDQVNAARKLVKDQGGEITKEFPLIKGFAVTYPEGTVQTLSEDPIINSFEPDKEVTIQLA